MAEREIDYAELIEKTAAMINSLEFDSARSAGKCKVNAQSLFYLYALKERYEAMLTPTPSRKVRKEAE